MRYLWDLKDVYIRKRNIFKDLFLNYLRVWDVMSSSRPDHIIANSNFVARRIKRYWGRDADRVIYPPVDLYDGNLVDYKDREDYFVVGAPFAENKGGEFIIECAKELGFNLKIIGSGRGERSLKRLAKGCKNIEFLGRVSEEDKYKVVSNAKGFIGCGIEDFGIFVVESISCGTPVLCLSKGGYIESVVDGVNGVLYSENTVEGFKDGMGKLVSIKWDVDIVSKSFVRFGKERFEKEVEDCISNIYNTHTKPR
jgi:glycosyltransferase involved in cell wall biosynthesis